MRRKTGQKQKKELAKGGRDPLEQLMEHLRAGDVSEEAALAMSPLAIRTIPTHAAITIANGGIASLVALATYGAPDDQEKAAVALATYGQKNAATTSTLNEVGFDPVFLSA